MRRSRLTTLLAGLIIVCGCSDPDPSAEHEDKVFGPESDAIADAGSYALRVQMQSGTQAGDFFLALESTSAR